MDLVHELKTYRELIMKYLLSQSILLILSVILLYFFFTTPQFLPTNTYGELDWYKISAVLVVIFLLLQSFISLVIYLTQKFLAYGKNEFPDKNYSLLWGLGLSFCIIISMLFHIFHLLNFSYSIISISIVAVLIFLYRSR